MDNVKIGNTHKYIYVYIKMESEDNSPNWQTVNKKRCIKKNNITSKLLYLDDPLLYIFPYGKYQGLPLSEVFRIDVSYINKCLKYNGMNSKYPIIDITFPKSTLRYLYGDDSHTNCLICHKKVQDTYYPNYYIYLELIEGEYPPDNDCRINICKNCINNHHLQKKQLIFIRLDNKLYQARNSYWP